MKSTLILIILILTLTLAGEDLPPDYLDLRAFEGNWSGYGLITVPLTDLRTPIEGTAQFTFDSTGGYLRTALQAEKLMFVYSDSGHFYYDSLEHTVTWEIWDNFKRHLIIAGNYRDSAVTGRFVQPGTIFHYNLGIHSADSLDFLLFSIDKRGKVDTLSELSLWREN